MISSTYRLQIRPSFDLHAAADLCDYLATLGVGATYLSPLLPSAKGSDHGYDVVAVRHGRSGPRRRSTAGPGCSPPPAPAGLGIVVDIVPNHAGVATPARTRPGGTS